MPTGLVTFEDGGTSIGTDGLDISTGTTTLTTSVLGIAGSVHSITVVYGGDDNFLASTSTSVAQTITQAGTTTVLAAHVNPSGQGQPVTFTAVVSCQLSVVSAPSGTVTFEDGGISLGTAALTPIPSPGGEGQDRVAMWTTSSLALGDLPMTAVYGGNANFTGSTANTLVQTVEQASTTTLTTSNPTTTLGQPVNFTAVVSCQLSVVSTPSGTVTFEDGGVSIGTGTLSAEPGNGSGVSTATFTTSSLDCLSLEHTITAVYGGDGTFAGSISDRLYQTVVQADTATVLTSSAATSAFGQTVTFTATLSVSLPGTGVPTGTVDFEDNGTTVGSGVLDSSGVATFSTSALDIADSPHTITASYEGDANFNPSDSGELMQTVSQASTSVTVTSNVNPAAVGYPVTFTATVTETGAEVPTGTVTFEDGGSSMGTALLQTPNTWTSLADMPTARSEFGAATGSNGLIYAVGGLGADGTCLDTVEAYSPATDTWTTVSSMPTARAGLAVAAEPNGTIYALGGTTADGSTILGTVEAYSPSSGSSSNTWTTVASMPTPRTALAAAVGPDGRIYAIGGDDTDGDPVDTLEVYTPSANRWDTVASLPAALDGVAAVSGLDGRIYVVGGGDASGENRFRLCLHAIYEHLDSHCRLA